MSSYYNQVDQVLEGLSSLRCFDDSVFWMIDLPRNPAYRAPRAVHWFIGWPSRLRVLITSKYVFVVG